MYQGMLNTIHRYDPTIIHMIIRAQKFANCTSNIATLSYLGPLV